MAPRRGTAAVGTLVAALAAAVLATWAGGDTALASLVPGWRVMVPSTAFGFICIGLGIAGFGSGLRLGRVSPPLLAALAAVLPVLTLVEYATGQRWGIESWLGIRFPADSLVAGRMSPVTSLALLLVATALAALPSPRPFGESIVRFAAGTALAISWLAVLAISFDASRLADVPSFPGMAVATVALLAVSGAAILASSAHSMARLRGAHLHAALAPGTLLAAFVLPLALGQARGLLTAYLDPGLANGLVVIAFAMVIAAVVWRTLARLHAFQQLRDRLLAELEARVDERTSALEDANRQLHLSEARLREADRRKDEFLATLAHELRNPLAPIRTGLEMLKTDAVTPQAATYAHQVIGRQLRHLVRLIDDLLDVSRITANKMDLRLERLSISEVLHQSVETSRADFDRSRHTLTLELTPEPVYVLGDPTRLTQIVSNLLQNACKYTPARRPRLAESVSGPTATSRSGCSDNGIGIAPADVPRLFEKFSQIVPGLERGGGGLGLGLALVRGLVSLHGGEVEVHSAGVGRGSEFVVRLPCPTAPTTPRSRRPKTRSPSPGRRAACWSSTTTSTTPMRWPCTCASTATSCRPPMTATRHVVPPSGSDPTWSFSTSGCRRSTATMSVSTSGASRGA